MDNAPNPLHRATSGRMVAGVVAYLALALLVPEQGAGRSLASSLLARAGGDPR